MQLIMEETCTLFFFFFCLSRSISSEPVTIKTTFSYHFLPPNLFSPITFKQNKCFSINNAKKNQQTKCSGLQWASGYLEGLKRKKYKIKGDRGKPVKNPPMLKLVFSLKLKNSNFRGSGNLLSFDLDVSLYSEPWSGYLFSNFVKCTEVRRFRLNFHNYYRSQKVQSYLL